jgi:hypothetical protein
MGIEIQEDENGVRLGVDILVHGMNAIEMPYLVYKDVRYIPEAWLSKHMSVLTGREESAQPQTPTNEEGN